MLLQSIVIMSDLCKLSHFAFLSRLADDPDAIYTRLFAVAFSVCYEHDKRGYVLELDEAELQLGRRGALIPI